jgi:hypothetical protein
MVVKIDNTSSSSPQIGLSKADLITEELVEGGATRLAVFYYSRVPKTVGPVRSFRASDIGIVKPADAVLVASGGAPPTVRRVSAAGIKTFTEGATGYYRDSGRSAPYNLFMTLPKLASTLKAKQPPADYLPWGPAEELPKGAKATRIDAQFSGGHTTSWKYAHGTYTNLNSYAADGDHFKPDSVLVLRVRLGDAGYRDPAGNPVPETKFTGSGDAMLFHDGRVVRGAWHKKNLGSSLRLTPKGGELAGAAACADTPRSPPDSACWRRPARMKAIAASTSALACSGSSADETDAPAADIAPKKIRLNVSTMLGSSS